MASDKTWSLVGSIAAIAVAGTLGAVAAWAVTAALDLSGLPGALLTVLLAMVAAVGLFVLGVRIRDALQRKRP